MVELLEYVIVCYGISIFIFDNLLQSIAGAGDKECAKLSCFKLMGVIYRVNKTSVLCICIGLLNAFLPMDKVNTAVFGTYEEHVNEKLFKDAEVEGEGFSNVKNLLNFLLYK